MVSRAPHQKKITVHKTTHTKNYLQLSRDERIRLSQIDTNSATVLILYLHLLDNADNWSEELSTKHLSDLYGRDPKTWERAVLKLIEEGYLVHYDGETENNFHFFSYPCANNINVDCSLAEFVNMNSEQQRKIYEAILKIDWDDMTEQQIKIHDYYVRCVMED